jgi:Collagen triple helix repeat (20 copies)
LSENFFTEPVFNLKSFLRVVTVHSDLLVHQDKKVTVDPKACIAWTDLKDKRVKLDVMELLDNSVWSDHLVLPVAAKELQGLQVRYPLIGFRPAGIQISPLQLGPAGPRGFRGVPGPKGLDGLIGERGAKGSMGLKGGVGLPGRPGAEGFPGEKGQKGEGGRPGLAGSQVSL